MKHAELIQEIANGRRAYTRAAYVWTAIFVLVLLLMAVLGDRSKSWPPAASLLFNVGGLVVLMFMVGYALLKMRKRNPRLICPHCGTNLTDRCLSAVVIASGNCGTCGKRVADSEGGEPVHAGDGSPRAR